MSETVVLPFTSPFLSFLPFGDGAPAQGWQASGGGFGQSLPSGAGDLVRWSHGGGGQSMSVRFNVYWSKKPASDSTAAYIYGTTSNSPSYTLAVDGAAPSSSDVTSEGVLGSFLNLSPDIEHTLTLNTSGSAGSSSSATDAWLAIQRVELTVPTGGNANYTYDDADTSHFAYDGTWGAGAAASQGTYMQTTTYTQQLSASARINFTGTACYLFGSIQPDHDLYSVSLDGVPQGVWNGSSRAGFTQQLLWFGSGFNEGFHEVVLTDVDGSKLDVDYIVVKSAPDTGRTKRIAGIAVGASVFAIILGSIVFWIWRTERNGRRKLAAYVQTYLREKEGY